MPTTSIVLRGSILGLASVLAITSCSPEDRGDVAPEYRPGTLSPANWDQDAWAQSWRVFADEAEPEGAAVSMNGMVVDAAAAPAAMAGAAALDAGGNAMDAVLTTALAGVTIAMGAPMSFAGVSALVYYDAATGTTHFLDAGWRTVSGETDIGSIPANSPSGRAILVPGFMAGIQAGHDRFGRLPFEALFEPSIHMADKGFPLPGMLAELLEASTDVLGRLPETRRVFTDDTGEWIGEGNVFRQPELAETLRRIASEGAEYMYRGPWAEKLVEAVQREGGFMTLEDLASYEALWSEPERAEFGGFQVHVPGAGGGTTLIEALHLVDRAGIAETGPVGESAESLYWLSRIGYLLWVADFRREELARAFPELDTSPEARRSQEHADRLWEILQTEAWQSFVEADPFSQAPPASPAHTDAAVAVDRWGNVAALIYTSNVFGWGRTGIFVDGVSVPDAGQLELVQRQPGIQPGDRVDNQLNPVLVLRDGRAVAASAALGAGIHHATLQELVNLLSFDMDAASAVQAPQAVHFAWPGVPGVAPGTPVHAHLVEEGRFPAALLDSVRARGQPVVEIPSPVARMISGRVSLVTLSPESGAVSGIGGPGGGAVPGGG